MFKIHVVTQASRARNSTYINPFPLMAWPFGNIPVTMDDSRTPLLDSVYFLWGCCQNLWQYFEEIRFFFKFESYYLIPWAAAIFGAAGDL